MKGKLKIAGIATGVLLVIAAIVYVYTTPYNRTAGVRIGGTPTQAPSNWSTVNNEAVIQLKLGGFPPFVVNIAYVGTPEGVISATRPDGGYWASRVRGGDTDGWLRIGDATYEVRGTEILEDQERVGMLEQFGAKIRMPMDVPTGGPDPLREWEVFLGRRGSRRVQEVT